MGPGIGKRVMTLTVNGDQHEILVSPRQTLLFIRFLRAPGSPF